MTPKVFIIQDDGRKNLSPAAKYGEVVVLATRDMPIFADTTNSIVMLRSKLKDYNPDVDFLLMTGDPLLIGATMALVAIQCHKVQCLKWDKQNLTYIPITIKF